MSADVLRAAAKLMRERAEAAEAAVAGPWHFGPLGFGYPQPVYNSAGILAAEGYGGPHGSADMATHIASMHPLVAAAVADWLDATGDEVAACGEDTPGVESALAVARAYLGSA
jgi:hypothetical protein